MLGDNSQPPFVLTSNMSHHTFTSRLLVLLVLSFSTIDQAFGKQISMPQSLLELQHSPAPYECAVLSAHVYGEDLQEGAPVVWMDPHTQQVHALHGVTPWRGKNCPLRILSVSSSSSIKHASPLLPQFTLGAYIPV